MTVRGALAAPGATVAGMTPPARRIGVTVSRTWTDFPLMSDILAKWCFPGTVLVSGHCPQGDQDAERIWEALGGTVERHPAQWRPGGRLDRAAGLRRNADMVAAGADVWLAFIRGGSRGASHCAALAEQAGIPVLRFMVPAAAPLPAVTLPLGL